MVAAASFSEHDPVMSAILRAPLSETPETEEERLAFEAVFADIRAGRRAGAEEVASTLAEMRRAQGG